MFYDEHIELKGTHLAMTSLHLKTADLMRIQNTIKNWIKITPGMFNETFMIIDFDKMAEPVSPQFLTGLKTFLYANNIFLAGIRNVCKASKKLAAELNIPVLTQSNSKKEPKKIQKKSTKIINKPIRSGQQTQNTSGDLIICGHVSSTAEIISTDNIIVIGSLRGKAIAGAPNQTNASIICSCFSPELISIAGVYLTCDNIPQDKIGKSIHITLEKGKLVLTELKTNKVEAAF